MESNDDLAKVLGQAGIKDKEARVYLTILSLGSSTAYEISQNCDVKNATVYVILEDLRKKGLVLKVPHAKKAVYAARDINEYLAEQRAKLIAVESIVPRLLSLGGSEKPNVYFFNGLNGAHEALSYKFDSMRGKTIYGFFGNLTNADKKLVSAIEETDKRMVAADVSLRVIVPEAEKENQKKLIELGQKSGKVEIKFLKEYQFPTNVSIIISDEFVRIIDSQKLYATVMDDKTMAAAMRQIFEIVWSKGV